MTSSQAQGTGKVFFLVQSAVIVISYELFDGISPMRAAHERLHLLINCPSAAARFCLRALFSSAAAI